MIRNGRRCVTFEEFTDCYRKALLKRWLDGQSQAELAELVGCGQDLISRVLRDTEGFTGRRKYGSSDRTRRKALRATRRLAEGKSYTEVGRELKVSAQRVRQY